MQPARSSRYVIAACSVVSCFLSSTSIPAAPVQSRVLDRIAQIRNLSTEQAARGLPVRLVSVVPYYDPVSNEFFAHVSSGGIYVSLDKPVNVAQGREIELTGVT